MRLALAAINPTVGDLAGNAGLIAEWCGRAHAAGADLVVLPELCLSGYPPRDMLLQEGFLDEAARHATGLVEKTREWGGLTVVFGLPAPAPLPGTVATGAGAGARGPDRAGIANALVACRDGGVRAWYAKRLLPTYDVFDEDRYFVPGDRPVVVEAGGGRAGLSVCEDLWRGEDVGLLERYAGSADPVAELARELGAGGGAWGAGSGVRVIVNPSASPFALGKGGRHRELLRRHAVGHGVHVAAVNQVGGNDELIFDGYAAVYGPGGELLAAGPGFEESLVVCELGAAAGGGVAAPPVRDPLLEAEEERLIFRALVLGVRDYLRKTGFGAALLGLSGGIDSAVTCVLAAAALGPGAVLGVSLPSRYSSEGSRRDAAELARRLGVRNLVVPIGTVHEALERELLAASSAVSACGGLEDAAAQNLQSRARGALLMGLSNQLGALLLTTGNKSELAVGYCTLYGDMNGGLAVLSDVTKQRVYRLARWMNREWRALGIAGLAGPPIPEASITKPPSAELKPGQTDQDTLPDYAVLDEVVARYVEGRQGPGRIARETGIDPGLVARLTRLIDRSEFKRAQAAVGLKVTSVAFGSGRRWPIAQGWRPGAGG
ncbi:MAG TPA: NAD+ synthase [Phycisphaerales bacterium]|nr:NAD+ synthase [Phycisphaerales bacterium]